jgi:HEAT repeat protein
METLKDHYKNWQKWVTHADKSEAGWQSDYPAWANLMATAISSMTKRPLALDSISYIDQYWAISEETEDLADYAKDHIAACWEILHHLAKSENPDTRWQVYEVLGHAGPKAESLLRVGLSDPDSYCRRRALLSLARLQPDDASQIAEKFVHDSDPYIRLASIEMVRVSEDAELIRRVKRLLLQDAVEFVRKAAISLGSA